MSTRRTTSSTTGADGGLTRSVTFSPPLEDEALEQGEDRDRRVVEEVEGREPAREPDRQHDGASHADVQRQEDQPRSHPLDHAGGGPAEPVRGKPRPPPPPQVRDG